MEYIHKFNSISDFKQDRNDLLYPNISQVKTPAGWSIGFSEDNIFEFYIQDNIITSDNFKTTDLSYFNSVDVLEVQHIIDSFEEGDKVIFNTSVAEDLRTSGELILVTKAYWDGNILTALSEQHSDVEPEQPYYDSDKEYVIEEDYTLDGLVQYYDAIDNQGAKVTRVSGQASEWVDLFRGISLAKGTKHSYNGEFDDISYLINTQSTNNNGFHSTNPDTFPFKNIGTEDFTYEFVFKAPNSFQDGHTGFFCYLSSGLSESNGRIQFGIETNGRIKVNTNTGSWINNYILNDNNEVVTISAGTYHDLAFVRRNGVVYLYDCGKYLGRTEANVCITNAPNEWAISDYGQPGNHYAHVFYDKALTQEEITKNANYFNERFSGGIVVRTYNYSISDGLNGTQGLAISGDGALRFNTGNRTGTTKGTVSAYSMSSMNTAMYTTPLNSGIYANHCNSVQLEDPNGSSTLIYVSGNYVSSCFVYTGRWDEPPVQIITWDTETECPEFNGMHPNIQIGNDGYLWAVCDDYSSNVVGSGTLNHIYKFNKPSLSQSTVQLHKSDAVDHFTVPRYAGFDQTWQGMKIYNNKIYFLRGANVVSKMGIEVIDVIKKKITEVIPLPILNAEPEDLDFYGNQLVVAYGNNNKIAVLDLL